MNRLDEKKFSILLVDSSLDISDYEQFPSSFEIISLDYESHHELSEKKIPHKISDEFISINELKKLDDLIICCDDKKIISIAKKYNILLINDAAQSYFSFYNNKII